MKLTAKIPRSADALYVLAAGALAGFCNGLVGCGGGIVIVYALSRLYRDDPERTPRDVFASAAASILPISAVSAVMYAAGGTTADGFLRYLLPAAAGGVVGAYLLDKIDTGLLGRIFAALVMWAGASMILRRLGVI